MKNLPALSKILTDSNIATESPISGALPPKAYRHAMVHPAWETSGQRSVLQSTAVTEIMSLPHWDDDHYYAPVSDNVVQRRVFILIVWVIVMMGLSTAVISQLYDGAAISSLNSVAESEAVEEAAPAAPAEPIANGIISPIFSPEVQRWAPQIQEWSRTYGVDANQIATIMQIESCGDPYAESHVGAQGLFQVMPFHFEAHENMKDPQTNAHRGINYFRERMAQTNGDVGRSFAGYNGGHGAAGSPYDTWPTETKHYYYWATGIYEDALTGVQISDRLDEWMAAGGYSLCQQASRSLGLR